MTVIPVCRDPKAELQAQIDLLQAQIDGLTYAPQPEHDHGGIYSPADHSHEPPDMDGYATDLELTQGLATKSDIGHWHGGEQISQRFARECDGSDYLSTTLQGVTVPGTEISMTIPSGSTVEFDIIAPLYFPSLGGRPNAWVFVEFGGAQKFVGQVYRNDTIGWVTTVSGRVEYEGVFGTVLFALKVSAHSGCTLITNDTPERYCKAYAKVYYDFSP